MPHASCQELAGTLGKAWKAAPRVYLTGRITVERDGHAVGEHHLPGRQGRRALAYLVLERARPVPIDELAMAVWGTGEPSGAWETALSAIISKVRGALKGLGLDARAITATSGCYQLALPTDAWVDVETARRALDEAEGLVRARRYSRAWGPANVAASIAERPFLAGDDGEWISRVRASLRDTRVRALECLAAVASMNGEHPLAARLARDVVDLEPFRETGWQRLMRALADAGNRAEALRAYAECHALMARELGVAPSPETEHIASALRTPGAR
jgi:DNA-binding SARP family transcriptional activator